MDIPQNSPLPHPVGHTGNGFFWIGVAFVILGGLAILLPAWATLTAELLIAWMMVFWGIIGLILARSMRPAQEWTYAAGLFGAVLLIGLIFLIFPGVGISTLTVFLMLIFLMEGVVSVILGLRLSGSLKSWGWMVFSGISSLAVGLIILFSWPEARTWVLGLLLGLNFLSTGFAMILLSRAAKPLTD